jgi:hypothetical protein
MPGAYGKTALNPAEQSRSPIDALFIPPEKTRGVLSFLTSPFVLASLFFSQQLLGVWTRPALGAEPTHGDQPGAHLRTPEDAQQSDGPFAKAATIAIAVDGDGTAAHAGAMNGTGAAIPMGLAPLASTAASSDSHHPAVGPVEWSGGVFRAELSDGAGSRESNDSTTGDRDLEPRVGPSAGLSGDQGQLVFDEHRQADAYPTDLPADKAAWLIGIAALDDIINPIRSAADLLALACAPATDGMPAAGSNPVTSAAEAVTAPVTPVADTAVATIEHVVDAGDAGDRSRDCAGRPSGRSATN